MWKLTRTDRVFFEYSQGLAYYDSGVIFTSKYGMIKCDLNYNPLIQKHFHIPPKLRAQGFNHFGDPAVHNDLIYVPIEGRVPGHPGQIMRPILTSFDLKNLAWTGIYRPIRNRYDAAFVACDGEYLYSCGNDTKEIDRYDLGTLSYLDSFQIDVSLAEPQGGAFHKGFLYITECTENKIYVISSPKTGQINHVISLNRPGEVEGIDFHDTYGAQMHVLFLPPALFPVLGVAVEGNFILNFEEQGNEV